MEKAIGEKEDCGFESTRLYLSSADTHTPRD